MLADFARTYHHNAMENETEIDEVFVSWGITCTPSEAMLVVVESIDSNTNEKVHLVHHFLRQSHRTSMLHAYAYAMLKMTLLWILLDSMNL